MKKLAIVIAIALTAASFAFGQTKDVALVYPGTNAKFAARARGSIMQALRGNKRIVVDDVLVKNASVALLAKYDRIVLMLNPADLKAKNIANLVAASKKRRGKVIVWTIDKKISPRAKINMEADVITSASAKFVVVPIIRSRIIPFILGK